MSSLRRFPPEIRDEIFTLCLGESCFNRQPTPALIVALRPDKQLYEEALETLFCNNYVLLCPPNGFRLTGMSQKASNLIRKIRINIGPKQMRFPEAVKTTLRKTPHVKEIYVSEDIMAYYRGIRTTLFTKRFRSLKLKDLRKITISVRSTYLHPRLSLNDFKTIEKVLGSEGTH